MPACLEMRNSKVKVQMTLEDFPLIFRSSNAVVQSEIRCFISNLVRTSAENGFPLFRSWAFLHLVLP